MIDDSSSERTAINKAWPSAVVLLCTFHFLQRRWTWLQDGQNKVDKNDRLILIEKLKNMVYANSESALESHYHKLLQTCPQATRYPHFLQHLQSVWEKRRTWAHCYRSTLPVRGNHTNNYAEAGIRILKELIFSRVKAYNLIQMFSFVTEIMEIFYQKKLLSLANNRIQTYIALRFQGINAQRLDKDDIQAGDNGWYKVQSQTTRGDYYSVNTHIGFCTCPKGRDGSPCLHQAAVVVQYGEYGLNFITSMSPPARQKLARIALGDGAIKDPGFYSSIHQESLEHKYGGEGKDQIKPSSLDTMDFSSTHWDLIRAGAYEDNEEPATDIISPNLEETCKMIDSVAEDLKRRLRERPLDEQLFSGTNKFIDRYNRYSSCKSNAMLASALQKFGWVFGGSVTSQKFGKLRHGKRITIQATAAGRRRKGVKKGKAPVVSGRPAGSQSVNIADKHSMQVRNEPKGKRLHNLSSNIAKGQQNAGKW